MNVLVSLNPKDAVESRGWRGFPWPISHTPLALDLTPEQIAFLRSKRCVVEGDKADAGPEAGTPFDEPLPPIKRKTKDKEA